MVKSKILFLIIWVSSFTPAIAQNNNWVKRYVNSIINDTTSAEKATLTVYPTFGSSPETGIKLGLSGLKLFYAQNDTLNRLSELQAFAFFTMKGQYGLVLENAVYGDKDKWFYLGETKIQKFPLSYFGIGPETLHHHPALVDAFQITFKQRILRKIRSNLFFGPEIDYQLLSGVNFRQPKDGPAYSLPLGSDGAHNLGLGLGLVYDNRHNVLNVRKGLFAELAYLNYPKGLLNDHTFNSINVEIRSFHPIGKRNVLAWNVLGQFMTGNVPFHQLSLLGGERMMRGYYIGRYRDNNLISAQVEYRILPFSFSKRLGAAVFASAGSVAPRMNAFKARNIRYAGGVGLRYLLFPKKDIYIRFDLGITEEGTNLYIFNGESF